MTPHDFLDRSELCELCGYRRQSSVVAWLARHGIPYVESRTGWPIVRRDALRPSAGDVQLNLGALRRRAA